MDGCDEGAATTGPVLIVLSPLRWDWFRQRPQHVVSRLTKRYAATWFVEEPVRAPVPAPRLRHEQAGSVRRVRLEIPEDSLECEFAAPECADYGRLLRQALGAAAEQCDVWLYGPSALAIAETLRPRLLVYDMMDELDPSADGGDAIAQLPQRVLRRADLVFTGSRSLHRTAATLRGEAPTALFPSGLDRDQYPESGRLRRPGGRPVAGYVGVIDERLDLDLLRELATRLDDWDVHIIGPVIRVDPRALPTAANLYYRDVRTPAQLPATLASLDVAVMPLVLNEATRSTLPTNPLGCLAAGLPVVSTPVPDVVADWSQAIRFADDPAEFAQACRDALDEPVGVADARAAALRRRHDWDTVVSGMAEQLDVLLARSPTAMAA